MRPTKLGIALYGALVASVPLLVTVGTAGPDAAVEQQDRDGLALVRGIWWRYEGVSLGDPVRFYYFHGDGKGLYRYGRVGYTNTHSFDYDIEGDRIVMRFRKSGQRHTVPFRIEGDAEGRARDWLVLVDDPREHGAARYFRHQGREGGPRDVEQAMATDASLPSGRMWMDQAQYATGGMGFSFYQLREHGIDGRGTGWHHRGDFDDWSTESLTFRAYGNLIEFYFPLRDERFTTRFSLREEGERRVLTLAADPRDFWHGHAYLDVGASFGTAFHSDLGQH